MELNRRERIREGTREEIKGVALKQIESLGVSGFSLRGIASEMGISAPALYNYYKSRDELVTALILDAYNSLADYMRKNAAGLPENAFAERFLSLTQAFRQWALENRNQYILIYGTPIPNYHAPAEATTPAQWRSSSQFMDTLEAAWQADAIQTPDEYIGQDSSEYIQLEQIFRSYGYQMPCWLFHYALAGWGLIYGLVALEINGHQDYLGKVPGVLYRLETIAFLQRIGLSVS